VLTNSCSDPWILVYKQSNLEPKMKNSSWKITTYENGSPAATAEGLDHKQAIAAVRGAMYGHDPLIGGSSFGRPLTAARAQHESRTDEQRVPVAA
jgi:hypothetical protein